ncbi:PolC-type DNA polymerase III [Thermovenabulum gondwanense]|uniref:DNA polymerase III PolC-type n=1 Tax=Thermovenabulum gondwanense TaxID=520767 RepID=A0A161PU39_9FIRM|nr:PolC-type DNA polymerase III [Thermovenabulum gondwanense]KYO65771.1 DNA polymerase III PolC-type [Thermovenabulum gondwanense]
MLNLFKIVSLPNYNDKEILIIKNTIVKKVEINKKQKSVEIYLECIDPIKEELINKITRDIKQKIGYDANINLNFIEKSKDYDKKVAIEIIQENWETCKEELFKKYPSTRIFLINTNWEYKNGVLEIIVEKNGNKYLEKKRAKDFIEKFFLTFGIEINVEFKEKLEVEYYDFEEEERKIVESILMDLNCEKDKIHEKQIDVILGKDFEQPPININSISGEEKEIVILGKIFDVQVKELKNEGLLVTFAITDNTASLPVKLFLKKDKKELINYLEEGRYLKIRGRMEQSKFTQEYELIPYDIKLSEKPSRKDEAEEKRIELHLHTKFSSMDAICSPKEVIEMVKSWGWKAIAFTDHGVVQAFPEIYEASLNSGVKPIYGMEAYIFDDQFPVIAFPPEGNIDDFIYVAVDIETTGLSMDSDEIIEIGAVKIYKGEIIDTFHTFIKPKKSIPSSISSLTGITNAMVENAPSLNEALDLFKDFIKDAVFVAHNAEFDSGFLRRDFYKLGIPFKNSVIDTVAFSAMVLDDIKNHKLDTVAKYLNIKLKNHHRATDDANALALIFIELIKRAKEKGALKLSDLNTLSTPFNINSYHAIILAQDETGLYNLYKLVSISHLNYFYRHPRIPKSLLNSMRQGLLIGSACESGELFQAILNYHSEEDIERLASFYDFLEIQPLKNNYFMVQRGIVKSEETLKEINKKIYRLGKKLNKPVVMTSDAHFINPEDEIYRKILLHAQGYQDYDKSSMLYLKTTKEMLSEAEYLGDGPAYEVVIENPRRIAELIKDNLKPVPDELYPPKIDGAEEEIINMTYKRAKEIYGEDLPEIVKKRIERELNSIVSNGYSVIYLIAHKLVKKSLNDGYLVGSRGSVGSSLVATMCEITEVNPLPPHYLCPECKKTIFVENNEGIVGPDLPDKLCPNCSSKMKKDGFNIPFEVFMGFEGDKVPDIDLNFSGEYQSKAHKYTEELFGKDSVFRAGTISTIAEKTAYGFVKSYANDNKLNLPECEIKRLAQGITGVKRTTGQHPGGLMVVPKDKEIYEFTPIQYPADDRGSGVITTHFDYHSISERLLKLDLLGHDDPTVIKLLEEETGVNAREIPLDDKKTMGIFSSLEPLSLNPEDVGTTVGTLGVPEFGTRFVRQMLEDTRPTTFSELVRISGLSHGTDVWLNNAQDLIKNKIATLKEVIATRDDIMLHLIEKGVEPKIAFNIMERVRKGKGLKPEEEEIMKKNNVEPWFIESCKKIKYMFPKAHAVAYVIMAFRIAYFKVYYPKAFYATYFTVRADDFDGELILKGHRAIKEAIKEIESKDKEASAKEKNLLTILEVANEMYLRGIEFLPVDLYNSHYKKFIITDEGILPPLTALPGLGIAAALSIFEERQKAPFTSIEDLRIRAKVTKNVIEILRKNGVLGGLRETDQICLF